MPNRKKSFQLGDECKAEKRNSETAKVGTMLSEEHSTIGFKLRVGGRRKKVERNWLLPLHS